MPLEVILPTPNETGDTDAQFAYPELNAAGDIVVHAQPDELGRFRTDVHLSQPVLGEATAIHFSWQENQDILRRPDRLEVLVKYVIEEARRKAEIISYRF